MEEKKNRKKAALIGMLFLITVCGCSGGQDAQTVKGAKALETQEEYCLKLYIPWSVSSERGVAMQKIVDLYNTENKSEYQVILLEDNGINEGNIQDIPLDGTADVYIMPHEYVQYLGERGELEDLTNGIQSEKEYFEDDLWNLGVVSGRNYGVPWAGYSMALIYNRDILMEAGVDAAKIQNSEDLVEACAKVEENTRAFGIGLVGAECDDLSWMVNQFIYGYGGQIVSSNGTETNINSPEARHAVSFYKNVLGLYAQPSWKNDTGVDVMTAFRNGQIAFEIQSLWGINDISPEEKHFELGVIPLRQIGLKSEVRTLMLAVPAGLEVKKKRAASLFMEYMVSETGQLKIMEGEYRRDLEEYCPFRLPLRKGIAECEGFQQYSRYRIFLDGFTNPSIDVPVPVWNNVKQEVYLREMHRCLNDEISIDDMLLKVQTQGMEIMVKEKNSQMYESLVKN